MVAVAWQPVRAIGGDPETWEPLSQFRVPVVPFRPDIKLERSQYPQIKRSRPRIGVWHTVRLTLIGRTLTVAVDGRAVLDRFEYPEELLSIAPSVIGLQKHAIWEMAGKMRNMPIEFRNVFIKEIASAH